MSLYPYNGKMGQLIQTDAENVSADRAYIAHLQWSATQAAAASTTAVHAAVTDTGEEVEVTTGITNPPCAKNITATAGGTATDIKAIQVIVEGTDMNSDVITETLPAFTENTAGSVAGSKAFATVTSITIPAHDGTGATTAIGHGQLLGVPYKLTHDTVIKTFNDNVVDTAPTLTVSATVLASNTVDFNGSLDGSVMDLYLMV